VVIAFFANMGNFKYYIETGGFTPFLYYQVGDTITAANGVQGKVVDKISDYDTKDYHDSLPIYSNTSEVYFKKSDKGGHLVEQARVYIDRKAALDFDWGHAHGEHSEGVVHVHVWHQDSKGNWVRSSNPRYMNNSEIARYGNLIKKANPKARLRP